MTDSLEERRVGGRERDKQYVYISLHTMNITGITNTTLEEGTMLFLF